MECLYHLVNADLAWMSKDNKFMDCVTEYIGPPLYQHRHSTPTHLQSNQNQLVVADEIKMVILQTSCLLQRQSK